MSTLLRRVNSSSNNSRDDFPVHRSKPKQRNLYRPPIPNALLPPSNSVQPIPSVAVAADLPSHSYLQHSSSTQLIAHGVPLILPPSVESQDELSPELLAWVYDSRDVELSNRGFNARLIHKNKKVTMILEPETVDLTGKLQTLNFEGAPINSVPPPENTHGKVLVQVLDVWNKGVPTDCEIFYVLDLNNQSRQSKPSINEKRLSNAGAKFQETFLFDASNHFQMELKIFVKFPEIKQPATKSTVKKSGLFSSLKRGGLLSRSSSSTLASAAQQLHGLTVHLGSVHFDMYAVNFGKATRTFSVAIDNLNTRVLAGILDGKKAGEIAAEVTMKFGIFRESPGNGRNKSLAHEDFLTVQMKTGRIPTWRRYWCAIDTKECALQLYDFEYKHDKLKHNLSISNVISIRIADPEIFDLANCFELVHNNTEDTTLLFADSKEAMNQWMDRLTNIIQANLVNSDRLMKATGKNGGNFAV